MTANPASSRQTRGVNHAALIGLVREYLALIGAWQMKVPGGMGIRPGTPDILAVCKGHFLAVEAKTGSAVLTPAQTREMAAIRNSGGLALEIRTIEQLEDALYDAGLIQQKAIMRFTEVRA